MLTLDQRPDHVLEPLAAACRYAKAYAAVLYGLYVNPPRMTMTCGRLTMTSSLRQRTRRTYDRLMMRFPSSLKTRTYGHPISSHQTMRMPYGRRTMTSSSHHRTTTRTCFLRKKTRPWRPDLPQQRDSPPEV